MYPLDKLGVFQRQFVHLGEEKDYKQL